MDVMAASNRAEFDRVIVQIQQSICSVRDEILATVRSETGPEFAAVRSEMATEFAAVRSEMADMHEEMHALHHIAMSRADRHDDAIAELRRHMLVLHEDLVSRISLLGETRR